MGCISLSEMTDLVNGRVSVEQRQLLEEHLRECAHCRNARHRAEQAKKDEPASEALEMIGAATRENVTRFYQVVR